MRFPSLSNLATLGLIGSVVASPHVKRGGDKDKCDCLTKNDAAELADVYKRLIGAFDAADAEKYLTDDFEDVSQSINTFIGKDYGAVTFDKASFITSQSDPQLPQPDIVLQGDPIFTCSKIVLIWEATFGAGRPARGISVIKAVKNDDLWQMKHWDVEFNSLNWAYDMGGYYCLFGHPFGNAAACGTPTPPDPTTAVDTPEVDSAPTAISDAVAASDPTVAADDHAPTPSPAPAPVPVPVPQPVAENEVTTVVA